MHAATGNLVPGKSTGTPRNTTPRQGCALLRMVRQDRFLSAQALTAWIGNLYGMRAGRKAINNRLLSRGYRTYRLTRKPLLTVNHCRSRLEWPQWWQNLIMAHWQHVIFGDESRFQFNPVDGRLRVLRLPGEHFQQRCQAYKVQPGGGSVHIWELVTVVPNRLLCTPTDTLLWAVQGHFAKRHSAICRAVFRE